MSSSTSEIASADEEYQRGEFGKVGQEKQFWQGLSKVWQGFRKVWQSLGN
jgi:hypothetical protein